MSTGNRSSDSVFLNALPVKKEIIDLHEILKDSPPTADWLSAIYNYKEASAIFRMPEYPGQQIRHLYFEVKNEARLEGASALYLAYPLVTHATADEFILAPLLFWPLTIESVQGQIHSWRISTSKKYRVHLNQHWLKSLADTEREAVEKSFSESLSNNSLQRFVNDICKKNGWLDSFDTSALQAVPGVDEIDVATQITIKNAGVAGLFRGAVTSGSPALEDVQATLESFCSTDFAASPRHPFSLLKMDPLQTHAFQNIFKNKVSLITGAPGTGKSNIGMNLIVNALSNGEKCLVVSNRVSTLSELQQKLSDLLSTPLHFLIKNFENEQRLFLEMLKAAANSSVNQTEVPEDWNFLVAKCERKKQKLEARYHAVNKKVFGTCSWTDTTGLFLKNNRIAGKELLASQLKVQDFSFTYDAYVKLEDEIIRTYELYKNIETVQHPFRGLHPENFIGKEKHESLKYLKSQLSDFERKARALHRRYIAFLDTYQSRLTEYYESSYQELAELAASIKALIEDGQGKYGASFRSTYKWVRFRAVFSSRFKTIKQRRTVLREKTAQLKKVIRATDAIELPENQFDPLAIPDELLLDIEKFEKKLVKWRAAIAARVSDELKRVNTKSQQSSLAMQAEIADLETDMDLLIEELNEAKIFKEFYENKMLTLPKRQRYMEAIIEHLEELKAELPAFDDYFEWQKNWLMLSANSQKVVRALIRVKTNTWIAAFESWYFQNCLSLSRSPDLPDSDDELAAYCEDLQNLKALMPLQIQHIWLNKRKTALGQIKKQNKQLYHYLEGKQFSDEALARISIIQSLEYITDYFPLLFVTPNSLAHLAGSKQAEAVFDWIIFEEAGLLSMQAACTSIQYGHRALVMGDAGPHTEEGLPTLLEWAVDNKVDQTQLTNKYSSHLKALHRFNDRAFQLEPVVEVTGGIPNPKAVNIYPTTGRFDEQSCTNETEAREVIRLLNAIQPTPQRTYPSVGIACFTVEQRDLILGYLQEIKSKNAPGSDTILQLERNGMGVFYIGNIRSEQFDILIASTTYGAINTAGKMSRQMDRINSEEGLQNLYTLSAAPNQALHFIHSLPRRWVNENYKTTAPRGHFLLAAFINYLNAITKDQPESVQTILKNLETDRLEIQHESEQPFLKAVQRELKPYFDENNVSTLSNNKLVIKQVYKNNEVKQHILVPNGFFHNGPTTSFEWELDQRRDVAAKGHRFHPLWAALWWKNAPQQARLLAGRLIRNQEVDEEE